ncbi:MAG: hypothetical protein ACQETE_11070 [Bacteroidota bacterium]
MKVVFDVRTDSGTPSIQKRIKEGLSGFRTKWGLYGTDDWWENLNTNNLIEIIEGEISDVYMSGHNDFPEFEVDTGNQKFSFERRGDIRAYEVGKKIKVEAVRNEYISPMSGLEGSLNPMVIKIES